MAIQILITSYNPNVPFYLSHIGCRKLNLRSEHIRARDPTTVKSVARVLHKNNQSRFTCEYTPARSHSNVLLVITRPGPRGIWTIT